MNKALLLYVLLVCFMASTVLNVAAQLAACKRSEDCRPLCSGSGTTPLCFQGFCQCIISNTINANEEANYHSPVYKSQKN
ncbi:hypothetical protein ACS0TY_008229 [Phlomoides rotata]